MLNTAPESRLSLMPRHFLSSLSLFLSLSLFNSFLFSFNVSLSPSLSFSHYIFFLSSLSLSLHIFFFSFFPSVSVSFYISFFIFIIFSRVFAPSSFPLSPSSSWSVLRKSQTLRARSREIFHAARLTRNYWLAEGLNFVSNLEFAAAAGIRLASTRRNWSSRTAANLY